MTTGVAIPVPTDFTAMVVGKSNYALSRHYGVNAKTVQRWRERCGISNPNSRSNARMPVPTGFEAAARDLTNRELTGRFGVSENTIKRWRDETGVRHHAALLKSLSTRSADMLVKKQNSGAVQHQTRTMRVPPPDRSTIEARAAEVLRRLASTYRCDERGRMNPRGQFWRHGNVVLTVDEMMRRAERHGWSEAA